jgi:hypothetical protein
VIDLAEVLVLVGMPRLTSPICKVRIVIALVAKPRDLLTLAALMDRKSLVAVSHTGEPAVSRAQRS